MNTDDFSNFWENPDNPFHGALGEDSGDKERRTELGSLAEHLEYHEIEELHAQVHDVVGSWLRTRVETCEVDIRDEARMATHCLSGIMSSGFEQVITESEEVTSHMIMEFARCCIQLGYAMRQDEADGELFI